MWLTSVSIRRPVFITMVVLGLIILGMQARQKMPAELRPKIDFPFITVVTVYPGAGPQEIETLVSKPVEDAVGSAGGLRNITSTSQDGVSSVFMEFELGTEIDVAAADVRDKLTAARANLPRDIEEPAIIKSDITAVPIMSLAVEVDERANISARDVRILADRTMKDALSKVSGVAAVYVSGGQVREVSVAVDRDRLQAYGLSIDQVAQIVRSENLNLPSGSVKEGTSARSERDYAVRTVGEYRDAEEIANTRIRIPDRNGNPGGTIRLGDIATVTDTVEEPSTLTRLNGRDSVVLAIQKQSDANTVEVAEGIKEELRLLNGYIAKNGTPVRGLLPDRVRLIVTTDESEFVEDALNDVNRALIEGIILVVLVVFLFLHSGRATLIVALAIPTSLIATYLPMWIFGFSMNMMTLLALALSVGILVDDSIVVLENIERHVRLGEPVREAALTGRSEIGLAAVTITLVDVVVFVPIAFMGGIVGQFFRQFGITVATATLFSLFMSFTLTPMLASRWLRSSEEEESVEERARRSFTGRLFARFETFFRAVDHSYRGVLAWALENRWLTIVIGGMTLLVVFGMLMQGGPPKLVIAALAVALPLLAARGRAFRIAIIYSLVMVFLVMFVHFPLGFEFLPEVDRGEFSVSIELPAGSGLDATDGVVRQVESILAGVPGMEYYQSTVGSSTAGSIIGGGDIGPQYARISVKMVDKDEEIMIDGRKTHRESDEDVVAKLNGQTALIPGGEIRLATSSEVGPSGQPIMMEITGDSIEDIAVVAGQVEARMKQVPGVIDVQNSWDVGKPELQVTVDRARSADMDMTVSQIASALRTSIEGNTDAKLRDQGEEYDIRVRLARLDRRSVSDVSNVIVGQRDGAPVYLRDVADVKLAAAPNKIDRKNKQRLITVGANTARGYALGNVQRQISTALETVNPGTARIAVGGTSQIMQESFGYMISALMLAVVLVYMLMGALFESFLTPLVIMFSLPQAMVGAFLALMLAGESFSIIAMIGIIMLMGLVTKNAILLVDYTNTLRDRGKPRNEAILEAGPTRLRPILMTTLAMIGGMLPTALAVTKGSEQRAPMAIAVIGGLIMSTLLTLLVIPTIYTVVDDWTGGLKRRLSFKKRPEEEQPEGRETGRDGHGTESYPFEVESDEARSRRRGSAEFDD
ncbi:MAG: efflux RND transporter permease subunit [Armatimonadetes bacterium]|nr:efflux RND transporter permease subunit [Armatimonadota bacterium]